MIKTINKKKVLPMLINQQRQHLFLHDHSAPDHDIPVVEDDGLPGRDHQIRL